MAVETSTGSSLKAAFLYALLLAGIGLVSVLLLPTTRMHLSIMVGLFVALVVTAWFDFDHYRIPNWISLPLIVLGLAGSMIFPGYSLIDHVAGAGLGYVLIWALHMYWRRFRDQDGIGLGDAKLLAAAGAWLGVLALPLVTLVASGSALLWVGAMALATRQEIDRKQRIPFGPFIAFGFWNVWLFQDVIVPQL